MRVRIVSSRDEDHEDEPEDVRMIARLSTARMRMPAADSKKSQLHRMMDLQCLWPSAAPDAGALASPV